MNSYQFESLFAVFSKALQIQYSFELSGQVCSCLTLGLIKELAALTIEIEFPIYLRDACALVPLKTAFGV